MNEKCPRCGSNIFEKFPDNIYATYPPQCDRILWCSCGYSENSGTVYGKTSSEILMDRWRKANKPRSGDE